MRFLADEGVDRVVVGALRAAGFDTLYVAEESAGLSDSSVLDLARAEGRILVTADEDFGDLVFASGAFRPESSSSACRVSRPQGKGRSSFLPCALMLAGFRVPSLLSPQEGYGSVPAGSPDSATPASPFPRWRIS